MILSTPVAVCCRVLQCVAVCCSVLQCVAVCCSVLQYVAVCCSMMQCFYVFSRKCHKMLHSFKPWYWAFLNMHIYTVVVCGEPYLASWCLRFSHSIRACGVTWLIHTSDVIHAYVWHDWLIWRSNFSLPDGRVALDDIGCVGWHDSFIQACHTYDCVMAHIWMSHGTHMSEAWHTNEWVMAHTWMSDVTHMIASWHAYQNIMTHIRKSYVTRTNHVTHINQSNHMYEWVMSHVQMSHVTCTNESCHTYEWVMSHVRMSHVTRTNESCHISQQAVLWLIRTRLVTHLEKLRRLCSEQHNSMSAMCCSVLKCVAVCCMGEFL